MKRPEWAGKIFVGGGFLRSIVSGDDTNDIDVFVPSKELGWELAKCLCLVTDGKDKAEGVYKTDNAFTLLNYKPAIQIIHRWTFNFAAQVCQAFDFTCCCAVFWWDGASWRSVCDERFYCDVAAKRLIYRAPTRNEDAGGSMLRVLKYYQKGYRIPLDSLANVMTRLFCAVEFGFTGHDVNSVTIGRNKVPIASKEAPAELSRILCGLLREVDPQVDPNHVAHLPAEKPKDEPAPALLPANWSATRASM